MRAGQTAARHQQILHAPWQQATVGNIVGPCIPSRLQILRLSAPGGVIPKDQLISRVWGLESEAEDNNVEVYISFLRKKLSFLASQVSIGTVRKVGYFLTTSDEPGSFGGGGMP